MGAEALLRREDIVLGVSLQDRSEAVDLVGQMLVANGSVTEEYVAGMHRREQVVSTYLGNGVAMPHGVSEVRGAIKRTSVVVAQVPDGVDWDGGTARIVIGLAAADDEHLTLLAHFAEILMDEDIVDTLATSDDVDYVHALLSPRASEHG